MAHRVLLRFILAVAVLFASGILPAEAQQRPGRRNGRQGRVVRKGKLDRALRDAVDRGDRQSKRVIIRARRGFGSTLRRALEIHGDVVERDHPLISGVTAVIHADDLKALENDPAIVGISIDAPVTAFQGPPPGGGEANHLRDTLGMTATSPTGDGIGIAILDSGIAPDGDLAGRITHFYDFTQGGIATAPVDGYGHGTHVAGLAASSGFGSEDEFTGVAPDARLVGLRVLDDAGQGYSSDVIAAVEFATVNKALLDIDVMNMSLGHPIFESADTDPLVQAVEAAVAAGIVVVASAGNHGTNPETGEIGYAGVTSPGNAPSALTVASVDTQGSLGRDDDRIGDYSSRGPSWVDGFGKPDFAAPGHRLVSNGPVPSTLYQTYPSVRHTAGDGDEYLKLTGTSMAAAVTTGVVAVLLQANEDAAVLRNGWDPELPYPPVPPLTSNALKAILQVTSIKLQDDQGVDYDWLTQGAGGINVAGALDLAQSIDTSVPEGDPWIAEPYTPSTTIDGVTYPWSNAIVWGDGIIWGDNIIWSNAIVWGDGIIWGNSVPYGEAILVQCDAEDKVTGRLRGQRWTPSFGQVFVTAKVESGS